VRLVAFLLIAISPLAARADEVADARAHYEKGLRHYNRGELDDAIGEFKAAFERSHAPKLLFNLAQAYRLKKEYVLALEAYEQYLEKLPAAKNRTDVEARIAEMKAAMPAPTPPPPVVETPPPPPVVETPPPPVVETPPPPPVVETPPKTKTTTTTTTTAPKSRKAQKAVGLLLVGVGVAVLGGGIAATVIADSSARQLRDLTATNGKWDAEAERLNQSRMNAQTAAVALYPVAAAALVVGTVITALGFRAQRATVGVGPVPGGAAAALQLALP
jgi:tetratricopeptide (TPR) repeat protein